MSSPKPNRSIRRGLLSRRVLALHLVALLLLLGLPLVASPARAAVVDCTRGSLIFAAHEDDDLIFMSPDLLHDISGGRCVLTVYATSADAGLGEGYWLGREEGVEAAYAKMAGVPNRWITSSVTVAGRAVRLRTLSDAPLVQLAFMRLPDGAVLGTGSEVYSFQGLERLRAGDISTMRAHDGTATYTKESFRDALVGFMTLYQPTVVRTLDFVGSYGDGDHSDHHAVGYFVREASERWGGDHTLLAYQGYGVAQRPTNLSAADRARKLEVFETYAQHDFLVCREGCVGSKEDWWLPRQYIRASVPSGNLARQPGVTVRASSEDAATGQLASKVVDGFALGYPVDQTREWVTRRGRGGSWITLTFDRPTTVDRVILYDRPGTVERILGGTLSFSNGPDVKVGPLADGGAGTLVSFAPRTVTSIRLTVDAVSPSTVNVGLTEFEVYGPSRNVARLAGTVVRASSEDRSTGQTAVKAVDGSVAGYPGDFTREWATVRGGVGSWIELVWAQPVSIDRVVLFDRPSSWEWITGGRLTFSDGSVVETGSLNNTGGTTVEFPARTVTSMRFTVSSVGPEAHSIGLAEIEAWGKVVAVNVPPVAAAGADQDVAVGSKVLLDGSASRDENGDALTYAWAQTGGPSVVLSGASSVGPSFVAAEAGTYEFSLTVSDGELTSVDSVVVRARSGVNVARLAGTVVRASSEDRSTGQTAVKAVDGSVAGYPGDFTREWATVRGGVGSWIELVWAQPVSIDRVVLFDRPSSWEWITGGRLTFSDGSVVETGSLNNTGGTTVEFPARTVTSMRFTVSSVGPEAHSIGLAEIEAWGKVVTP